MRTIIFKYSKNISWSFFVAFPYIFFFPILVFSKKWSVFILFPYSTLCWKLDRIDKAILSFGIMNSVLVVTAKKFIIELMDRVTAHLPVCFCHGSHSAIYILFIYFSSSAIWYPDGNTSSSVSHWESCSDSLSLFPI